MKIYSMLKQKNNQIIFNELFLLLNQRLRINIEPFLPEKNSNRKTSKHWVNELKNAAAKSTGLGNFF